MYCVQFEWISVDLIEFDVGYVDYASERMEFSVQWQVEM
jgi:hypothetical protein